MVGKHDKPGDDNGNDSDSLPGQPWTPPAPPSPDGGAPEGGGEHRK
ncbi:hypothetical protein GCM10009654_04620 [Streptomyces hebeiensis]|uniref:RDD family protein n=1 Tax=Streptomyces hebeiensis TaxID=229486 RepID=A0ABN1UKE6_9ACTN